MEPGHNNDFVAQTHANKKPGLGARIKNMFGGKNKKAHLAHGQGGTVVEEQVHTKTVTTTTTVDQGGYVQGGQHHHLHGPLVANPYAQPAHGQIFVPANTAVSANPETGALLPASSLNGPVILPTGPKVIPIATNYPAGQAGPMVIPPSGGFINNSGNPYLTQQSYGPAGVLPAQGGYYQEGHHVDSKAAAKLEKEELKRERKLEKEHTKEEKRLEKEAARLEKDEIRLEKQIEKDQAKIDKTLTKDEEKLYKDQQKMNERLAKDEAALANNQYKLQERIDKTEGKLENKIAQDEMKIQQTLSNTAGQNYYAGAPLAGAPLAGAPLVGGHGTKHVYAEETKQNAYTGQVLDHNEYHKDSRF